MARWMHGWVVDGRVDGWLGKWGLEDGWVSGAPSLDPLLSEGCWQVRVWPEEGLWQKQAYLFHASGGEKEIVKNVVKLSR